MNAGSISAGEGPMDILGDSVDSLDGQLIAKSDLSIHAAELIMENSLLSSGQFETNFLTGIVTPIRGKLRLNVSDRISDGSGATTNKVTTLNGFDVLQKPATGDFLRTDFTSISPRFASISHSWPAEDRGPSLEGFGITCDQNTDLAGR